MPKILLAEETWYISQKCEISVNCLPNVSLRRDLNVAHQPQQLLTWLVAVFCLEFEYKSIYRAIILINALNVEIDP